MTQTRKKLVFSWVLILAMVISVISPGSVAFVNAEEAYDGYVYVTVERFTLGQGLATEPKKIGYKEDETMADILSRGFGSQLITEDTGYGAYIKGFSDGGEPEGWNTAKVPTMISEALQSSSISISDSVSERRASEDALSGGDYTGGYNSYWSTYIDDVSSSVGISGLTFKEESDSASYHNGSVLRIQFSIDGGNDLKSIKADWNNPLRDVDSYPDMDELIRQIVDFSGNKKSAVYTDAISVLEDWDATESEVKEVEGALETAEKYSSIYSEALINAKEKLTAPAYGNEWTVLSIARTGLSDETWNNQYIKSVEDKVKELNTNILKKNESTENSKIILLLKATGGNPENVAGYNLVTPLADFDYVKKQGVNGMIYALLALDCGRYEVPKLSGEGTQTTRQLLVDGILDAQIEGGGWDWMPTATTPDPDLSGMAIQALAPYYNANKKVKSSVDNVLSLLSAKQDADGGYSSWGYANSCSCAQVICGLTALDINPDTDKRFIKNGKSLLDATLAYYNSADKSFKNNTDDKEGKEFATDQVLYSLTALDLMFNSGSRLFMSKDHTEHGVGVIINAKEATCTAVGYTGDKVCDDCGEVLEKGTEIAKKAHTPVEIPAVAATETTPGKTAGKKCSVCGEILEQPKEVPATGKTDNTEEKKEDKVEEKIEEKTVFETEYKVTGTNNSNVEYTGSSDASTKSIVIPATVTDTKTNKKYKVTKVAAGALKNNKKVTSVTVGKNVTEIGKNAFNGCKKAKTFKIYGNKLTKVGKNAFKNIKKNAKIIIYAKNNKTYKKVKKLIEKSGAKNVKYQYKNKK